MLKRQPPWWKVIKQTIRHAKSFHLIHDMSILQVICNSSKNQVHPKRRRCKSLSQCWNGKHIGPNHLYNGFVIPYPVFWCTIHQHTVHICRDIQVNQNCQKEATNDPLSEAIAKELANRSKNQWHPSIGLEERSILVYRMSHSYDLANFLFVAPYLNIFQYDCHPDNHIRKYDENMIWNYEIY